MRRNALMASLSLVLILNSFLAGEAVGVFDSVRVGGGAILTGNLGIADRAAAFDSVELAFLLDAAVLSVSFEAAVPTDEIVVLTEDTALIRAVPFAPFAAS
jgi:hypothetical protein